MSENFAVREAYGLKIAELGLSNENIAVLDADVSKSTRTQHFSDQIPRRFYNMGIAEQNMMSVAAGMATIGVIPFVNSFSFLTTYRAADQFRTSIVYPGLNVKVMASYGGLSDSYDGPTHQTLADIAWVRALPNLTVIVPSDSVEMEKVLPEIINHNGPVWVRICRAETSVIHKQDYEFKIGKAEIIREGKDVSIISCGVVLDRVLKAADKLIEKGIDPMIINMPTIKPLDEEVIKKASKTTSGIVTVEEHNILGGLGAAVSEVVTKYNPTRIERIGIPDTFAESGAYDELLEKYGLGIDNIVSAAESIKNSSK